MILCQNDQVQADAHPTLIQRSSNAHPTLIRRSSDAQRMLSFSFVDFPSFGL